MYSPQSLGATTQEEIGHEICQLEGTCKATRLKQSVCPFNHTAHGDQTASSCCPLPSPCARSAGLKTNACSRLLQLVHHCKAFQILHDNLPRTIQVAETHCSKCQYSVLALDAFSPHEPESIMPHGPKGRSLSCHKS